MRQKVKTLTGLVKEYNKLSNDFENKKTLFNLRVDDLCEDYECSIYPLGMSEEQINEFDAYSKAKHFFVTHDEIIKALNHIRQMNSGADRKTLNSLYTGYLVKEYGFDYTTAYLYVSNYNIFIEAGFYKTLRSENLADICLRKISGQAAVLKQHGIDALDGFIEDAKAKITPYAKSATGKVKPVVHEGSKTLAKVFSKIADKTQKKND